MIKVNFKSEADDRRTKSILDELKGIAKPSKGSDQEGKNNETQYAQIKAAIDSIYEKWLETAYPKAKNTKLVIAEKKDDDSSKKENSVLELQISLFATNSFSVLNKPSFRVFSVRLLSISFHSPPSL